MKSLKYLTLVILTGAFFFGCSGASKVESSFAGSGIKIDGDQSDWAGSLKTIEGDNMAYGFKNDGQNLYLCLVTSDASKALRMLTMGLTVWLNPGSSKDEIGVKFPLKPDPSEMRDFRMQQGQNNQGMRGDGQKRIQDLISMQKELTVTNKDDLPLYSSSIETAKDFQVKLGYEKDQFVYELKVPLESNKNAQAVLKTQPGEDIEVKIETGKFDISQRQGGMRMGSGGGEGGNRPPMGGSGRQGGGRRGGGERGAINRDSFKPIEYSFNVTLSK
ncbi:MAG: hypothetical protein HF314_03705 [Ignavibacteria bacterium]|nr:hypothetical protein [Ignavibacteria bacterium]MCU7502157.1 hypothetical protein [Ignavibacteria bacterium]MCU7515559.1 hypothetical protein [Ignavibacteria bacterium]